jgi:hypothetical protein
MRNAYQLEAAILLAVKVPAQPNKKNNPIPRKPMVSEDKLKAEGGLSETKIILEWHFNFRTHTLTLPKHKLIVRSLKIHQIISTSKT